MLATALLLCGCGPLPAAEPDAGVWEPAVLDCEPPLVFEGDSTIAQLGLADAVLADAATESRRGSIRVTGNTVRWEDAVPPNVPARFPEGQMLCITWEDGTGMSTLLPVRFGADGVEGPVQSETSLPVVPIVVALAFGLIAGLSWLAFRREAPPSA